MSEGTLKGGATRGPVLGDFYAPVRLAQRLRRRTIVRFLSGQTTTGVLRGACRRIARLTWVKRPPFCAAAMDQCRHNANLAPFCTVENRVRNPLGAVTSPRLAPKRLRWREN